MPVAFKVAGADQIFIQDATTANSGFMSAADKTKLNAYPATPATTGNWVFTNNNADLSAAGAIGIGVGGTATSVAFGPAALSLAANSIFTGASSATNTTGVLITSNVADGASSVAVGVNNTASLANATASSFQIQNAGTVLANYRPALAGGSGWQGNSVVFPYYNSQSDGIYVGSSTVQFVIAGNAKVTMSATAFNSFGDGGTSLGVTATRWNGLYNAGPLGGKYNVQAGTTYTVLATDWYVGLTNSAARTITLAAASAFYAGQMLVIDDQSGAASTGSITINRAGADTIDGGTSTTIITNNGDKIFISDGVSKWFTIAKGL